MIILYTNLICAAWTGYIVDAVALLIAVILIVVCAKRGFIGCLLGMVSTLLALIVAVFLAKPVLNATDGLFGLQEKFCQSFTQSFAKIKGFNTDISAIGVEEALEKYDVTAVFGALILKLVGKQEALAVGTTIASLLGEKTSLLAATLITGIVLFIIIKLAVWLLRGLFKGLVKKIKLVNGIDTLLGAVVGFAEAFLIVCGVLAVLAVIPVDSIATYLEGTLFVGKLFAHNPLVTVLGWLL